MSAADPGPSAPLVWLNGVIAEGDQARVSALDHGITVGDGVFETCVVRDGEVFALDRHLARLARSAELMGLEAPDDARIRAAADELLAARPGLPLARLRITMTGGVGPMASDRGNTAATLIVGLAPTTARPERAIVVTVPWTRNEHSAIAGVKSTSYAENVIALRRATDQGADEAILANTAGMLSEGTGSNVVVDLGGGHLVTPPLSSGCLAGITRGLLLEWAAADGLPIREQDVPFAALATAADVLLTSTTRNVQQVARLDGAEVAGSDLGRRAVELFRRRAAESANP